jgi:hypothetical protein
MRKRLFPRDNVSRICGNGISCVSVSNKDLVLRRRDYEHLKFPGGFCGSAAREKKQARYQGKQHTTGTHRENRLVHVDLSEGLLDHLDVEDHRSVACATEVRTLTCELSRFCGCQRDFGVFIFFDFRYGDTQLRDGQAVGHIRAVKDEYHRLILFQRDLIRAI